MSENIVRFDTIRDDAIKKIAKGKKEFQEKRG